jgi:hypothetical protein
MTAFGRLVSASLIVPLSVALGAGVLAAISGVAAVEPSTGSGRRGEALETMGRVIAGQDVVSESALAFSRTSMLVFAIALAVGAILPILLVLLERRRRSAAAE